MVFIVFLIDQNGVGFDDVEIFVFKGVCGYIVVNWDVEFLIGFNCVKVFVVMLVLVYMGDDCVIGCYNGIIMCIDLIGQMWIRCVKMYVDIGGLIGVYYFSMLGLGDFGIEFDFVLQGFF